MDAEDPFPLKDDPEMDSEDPLPEMDTENPFSEMDVEGLFADGKVKVVTISYDFKSILSAQGIDFLVRNNNGDQVPISCIEGKMVALYFIGNSYEGGKYCPELSPKLVAVYNDLKADGKDFEVLLISVNDDEEDDEKDGDKGAYKGGLDGNPFLDIPFKDEIWKMKLAHHYKVNMLPMLVIIGPNGEILNSNASAVVEDFGIRAYPFTTGRKEALKEIEKSWRESQTLESLLVCGERDFVIRNDNVKVQASDLVGKYNLLYFSRKQSDFFSPVFLQRLIAAYTEMKRKEDFGEIIFISEDSDEESFNTLFKQMPWVALPFGELRKSLVDRRFCILTGTPAIKLFGPTGKFVRDALGLIWRRGHTAYPFTEGVAVSNL